MVSLDVEVDQPRAGMIHILKRGYAMCGTMSYPPSTWPDGHWWIGTSEYGNCPLALGQHICHLCAEAFSIYGDK